MLGAGRGTTVPSAFCSNCMKTRFQSSTKRSQSQAGSQSGRPQPGPRAVVPVDLRAGPARARVAHPPEVVLLAVAEDPGRVDARLALPERLGLRVGPERLAPPEHGQPEPLPGQGVLLRHQLPAEGDRVLLEVVAEGEVPEHLEEGVMPRGPPDLLQVVVLAGDAQALLRRDGAHVVARLPAGEDVLELVHARVREQQRRIARGDERGAAHDAVPALLEEAQEGLTCLLRIHRLRLPVPPARRPPRRRRSAGP